MSSIKLSYRIGIIFKQIYFTHWLQQLVPLPIGVNLGVMEMKGCLTLTRAQELEPHHQVLFSIIPKKFFFFFGRRCFLPLCVCFHYSFGKWLWKKHEDNSKFISLNYYIHVNIFIYIYIYIYIYIHLFMNITGLTLCSVKLETQLKVRIFFFFVLVVFINSLLAL